ncbi:hypothetical protein [Yoonia sp. 208BN28-4]|uniref:hypothetical protein n=1 Tax=Yoonia sp. 208BN28-4 TaxID=3126505 RepID=UPI0030AEBE2B
MTASIAALVLVPVSGAVLTAIVPGGLQFKFIDPLAWLIDALLFATLSFLFAWIPLVIAAPLVKWLGRGGVPSLVMALAYGAVAALVFCAAFGVFGSGDVPAVVLLGLIYAGAYHAVLRWAHRRSVRQDTGAA